MNCNRPYKKKISKRLWEETLRWAKRGEPSNTKGAWVGKCHDSQCAPDIWSWVVLCSNTSSKL